jgi:hypothetical protein
METHDDVQEVKVHAISLRRPKARKRAAAVPPSGLASRTVTRVWDGVSLALEPTQQSWLALLGLSSLAVKSTTTAWSTLVDEGTRVQTQLNRRVAGTAKRLGLTSRGTKRTRAARPPGPAGV